MKHTAILLSILFFFTFTVSAQGCGPAGARRDLLAALLAQHCPQSVQELTKLLRQDGLRIAPHMVANRGRHNPARGSFSLFETAEGPSQVLRQSILAGHFYFGHFSTGRNGTVQLDQAPAPGKLLVEVMSFDFQKGMYNFYELIGEGKAARWFYRGDSRDALLDNEWLQRGDPQRPQFGTRMRCSACHSSGGPIMKELAFPHNDWWREDRHLPFGPNAEAPELTTYLQELRGAESFARDVRTGMDLLESSPQMRVIRKAQGLQEKLRPLFCSTEINLHSAFDPSASGTTLKVPSEIFVNPLLVPRIWLEVDHSAYQRQLRQLNFVFPETNLSDADHAFLAPVKGQVDLRAIQGLIAEGVVTEAFALSVLATDLSNPLFSSVRCELLKLLPGEERDWPRAFISALGSSQLPGARELRESLTSPDRGASYHRHRARAYLETVQQRLTQSLGEELLKLQQLREKVGRDEISKNPRGQILEPGFRVIFPERRLR